MNKQQINVFATRDLSGCICAVYGHLVAAEVQGGVTVDWINPGDLSSVHTLIYALGVARANHIQLPDVRSIFVCGAAITKELRDRFKELSSEYHEIGVYQFDVLSGVLVKEFEDQMNGLLNLLGPDNFVSVMVEFCKNHPEENMDIGRYNTLREFITYAGQQ